MLLGVYLPDAHQHLVSGGEHLHNICDYIDAARARLTIRSDRQLSIRLGLSDAVVSQVRRGITLLSDEKMAELAALAGWDKTTALIELNIWRTRGETQHLYIELLQRRPTNPSGSVDKAA